MENVTKALLIAGGVLFAILVLTLLVIFHNQISSYYSEEHDAKMIEQVTEFNSKFDNYNAQTIRGNELITVMNRVVDYNRTYSDIQGYQKVVITVDLKNRQNDLLYSDDISNTDKLFKNSIITNKNGRDEDISKIAGLASELAESTGIDDTKLQKLSADIATICNKGPNEEDEIRNEKLQKILGYKNKTFQPSEISNIQKATIKYYQLTQFKRAMFKCTEVVHSQKDGRVNKISFEVVIENGTIKLN